MELQLTNKEEELVLELLQEQQKHLLHQIAKADHHEFRASLRARYELLEGIMNKMAAVRSAA